MRVTCDFVGFLRAVRDGIWKIEGAQGEEKAWDESVRLRERMFWARLGTQGWEPPVQNGRMGSHEERKSTETAGSGVDPLTNNGPEAEPVTPELHITKAFEDEAGAKKEESAAVEPTVEPSPVEEMEEDATNPEEVGPLSNGEKDEKKEC
jgi:hypothetical protein